MHADICPQVSEIAVVRACHSFVNELAGAVATWQRVALACRGDVPFLPG